MGGIFDDATHSGRSFLSRTDRPALVLGLLLYYSHRSSSKCPSSYLTDKRLAVFDTM